MSATLHFVYKYISYIFFSRIAGTAVDVVVVLFFQFFFLLFGSASVFRHFSIFCLFAVRFSAHSFIYLSCELCCVLYVRSKFILVNFFPIIFHCFCTYFLHTFACLLRACVFCILSFHTPVGIVDKIITCIDICF